MRRFTLLAGISATVVCSGLTGCQQPTEPAQPVVSQRISPPEEDPEPTPAQQPEPAAVMPQPEPAEPPPSLKRPPAITMNDRLYAITSTGRMRGIGFRVSFQVTDNPDNAPLQVTIRNRLDERVGPIPARLSGNVWGIEYFQANLFENGNIPFQAQVEYYDRDTDMWIPITGWMELKP